MPPDRTVQLAVAPPTEADANRALGELAVANEHRARARAEVERIFGPVVRDLLAERLRAVLRDRWETHSHELDALEQKTWVKLGGIRSWDPVNPLSFVRQAARWVFQEWFRGHAPHLAEPFDEARHGEAFLPDDGDDAPERLREALRGLDEPDRELVLLHQGLGLEYPAIFHLQRMGLGFEALRALWLARGEEAVTALNDVGRAAPADDAQRRFVRRARERHAAVLRRLASTLGGER
jgi:DNA-directed RNA polymerase specialized sigma24 family protein